MAHLNRCCLTPLPLLPDVCEPVVTNLASERKLVVAAADYESRAPHACGGRLAVAKQILNTGSLRSLSWVATGYAAQAGIWTVGSTSGQSGTEQALNAAATEIPGTFAAVCFRQLCSR